MQKIEVNGLVYEFEDDMALMSLLDENANRVYERTATEQTPPNAPLTLDELREMDGKPVWIRNHCSDAYTCRVIRQSDAHFTYFTDGGLLEDRSCGSYWTAYRRKPEEGTT